MIAFPYDSFLTVWLVLAAASSGYVELDQFAGSPGPTVMMWVPHSSRSPWGHLDFRSTYPPGRDRMNMSTSPRCGGRHDR
ncbi:hypothetical protein HMPREF9695_04412 [Afipia broomeae ATCC 49717]|uniref:Uncharacterized protein n=1 Tax=Afipia broomeae ATCC 49717 TaxID=883078 RepID=K8NVY9_9BRAD|nr:hypothetical protein HMPREF9695_04412 [Afipia broomeae ATCC 49717]